MKALTNVRVLVGVSLFCALNVVLNLYSIQLTSTIKISFASLTVAASCYFYGPCPNVVAAFVLDVVNYVMKPTGPYQPWFAVSAMVVALIYGLLFYKQEKVSFTRIVIARILYMVVVNLMLNSLWLSMMYGDSWFALVGARLFKNIAEFPFQVALLYACLRVCERIKPRLHIH